MTLIQLILVLVILGVAWYLLEKYVPLPPVIWLLIRVIIVIAVIVFLLELVGINTGLGLGRLRL